MRPFPSSGEKRLKHQVLHSPEWADSGAREALAAAVLPSYPSLAAVLRRAETSASLRKPHYFVLARAWGYKSDSAWGETKPHAARRSITGSPAPPDPLLAPTNPVWMPARSDAQPAKWAAKAPRRGKGGSPSSGGGESVSV